MEHEEKIQWFDTFTRNMLITGFILLSLIFASAFYMDRHKMDAGGTDDLVNNMASKTVQVEHHPLVELPGDAEVSAFSVGNFFAALIIGYNWRKLFYETKPGENRG
jgi:cobalt/nickel transport protein